MVSTKQKKEGEFSIERFESVMLSTGTTWKQLNETLEYNVEKMLKDSSKPPMLNVISKACSIMGLANSDYVMMKVNTYKLNNYKGGSNINDDFISGDLLDVDMINLYVQKSEWSFRSLAAIMSFKSVLCSGTSYFTKISKSLRKEDLNNLCWALGCKKSDICRASKEKTIPKRIINKRDKYILNPDTINGLSKDMDRICKQANISSWFVYSDKNVYVSLEMVDILCKAIKKVTKKEITGKELCLNYNYHIEKVEKKKASSSKAAVNAKPIIEEVKEETKEENKMNIPDEIVEMVNKDVIKEEKQNTSVPGNKFKPEYKRYNNRNNQNYKQGVSAMKDLFNAIDHMSDTELNKLEEYLVASKKLRELKNSLLK